MGTFNADEYRAMAAEQDDRDQRRRGTELGRHINAFDDALADVKALVEEGLLTDPLGLTSVTGLLRAVYDFVTADEADPARLKHLAGAATLFAKGEQVYTDSTLPGNWRSNSRSRQRSDGDSRQSTSSDRRPPQSEVSEPESQPADSSDAVQVTPDQLKRMIAEAVEVERLNAEVDATRRGQLDLSEQPVPRRRQPPVRTASDRGAERAAHLAEGGHNESREVLVDHDIPPGNRPVPGPPATVAQPAVDTSSDDKPRGYLARRRADKGGNR